jgi:virginiamycin B lyase
MARLRAHVVTCAACQRQLTSYEHLAQQARTAPLPADLGATVRHPRVSATQPRRRQIQTRSISVRRRRLAIPAYLGPLAAVLVVALVAGVIFTALRLRITPPQVSGALTTFYLAPESDPSGIVRGPDGALWYTEPERGKIGRISTTGRVTEFAIPDRSDSEPRGITVGADGALYFTEYVAGRIGRITTSGVVTTLLTLSEHDAGPLGVTTGPDGALWFTEVNRDTIGRITLDGRLTEFTVDQEPLLTGAAHAPTAIVVGADGALYFTQAGDVHLGRITTAGAITLLDAHGVTQSDLERGPDGTLWFTAQQTNQVGRITPRGDVTLFAIPTTASTPSGMTLGPDGAMWFVERAGDKLGRITADGVVTELLLPKGTRPTSITVGADQALWITGQASGTILRYRPPS